MMRSTRLLFAAFVRDPLLADEIERAVLAGLARELALPIVNLLPISKIDRFCRSTQDRACWWTASPEPSS